ncbi:MAG TPA: sugar ABC transporter ATP-binding protein [Anaeromyxobacteraceae bacterium]|nr:sugar ABC transporter ATP-binding protein [Anaeromyxobacteraceae bacterium]
MEPLLQVRSIRKNFEGVKALDGVDLSLFAGEVHALMGENGAGKSTLVNIVSGLLQPTSGTIAVGGRPVRLEGSQEARRVGISTITQEFNLVPELSVAENLFLGREPTRRSGLIDWKEMRSRSREVLARVGLKASLNQRVEYLDVADRQLVEIAKALSGDFRVMLMDEPTAALNAAEVDRLFEIIHGLRQHGTAVLYVSHRLNEVFRIADKVTVLRDGIRVGTRDLSGLTEDEVVTMMLGRALAAPAADQSRREIERTIALSVRDLRVPGALHGISFELDYGEVLGCAGLIGSGRAELTRTLFGLQPRSGGTIRVNGIDRALVGPREAVAAGMSLLAEDRKTEGIFPDLSVLENIMIDPPDEEGRRGRLLLNGARERRAYEESCTILNIKAQSPDQLIAKLSGGNQQKVMIGRALVGGTRILLLNEPTRGVDVGTKAEIHALVRRLAREGYAILLSSSDVPELVATCDRCLVLVAGILKGELRKPQLDEDSVTALAIGRTTQGHRDDRA